MDALLWKRIGEVFDAARQLDHVDQVEFMKQQCGNDQALTALDGKRIAYSNVVDEPDRADSPPRTKTLQIVVTCVK